MPAERKPEPPRGFDCPRCGCNDVIVTHTWPAVKSRRRRRRKCRHCEKVFITFEITQIELGNLKKGA